MRVLLIGSGGREHALAWKLAQSPLLETLFIAPGNPGTAQCGTNVALNVTHHADVIAFCQSEQIDLVVVGPEAPLVAGLVDDLEAHGIKLSGLQRLQRGLKDQRPSRRSFASRRRSRRPPMHDLPIARRPRPMCGRRARRL